MRLAVATLLPGFQVAKLGESGGHKLSYGPMHTAQWLPWKGRSYRQVALHIVH